jgi:large subunit ribosomal protein L25
MAQLTLKAEKRDILGRKVKKLRRDGILPANLFGKKIKSLAIQVSTSDFKKVFDEAGETNIINLMIEKQTKGKPVLVSNLQEDPTTDAALHVDFHQVDLKEKVTVDVPIEIEGESPAVKEKGAVLIKSMDEIKVEALPNDLPDEFKLEVSKLIEFGDSLLVRDLPVDKKKVAVLANQDEVIAVVQEPKKEEEPEKAVEEEAAEEAVEGEEVKPEEKVDDKQEQIEPKEEAGKKPNQDKEHKQKKTVAESKK